MEKDNKRAREVARREFNEAVRNLAAFIRKRDPRYKEWKERHEKASVEKAAEEKKRRAEEKKKERERRADEYVIPEWAKVADSERDAVVEAAADMEVEELFCLACNKAFKSESSFANHERSRKHMQNVEILREQLLEEEDWGDGDEVFTEEREVDEDDNDMTVLDDVDSVHYQENEEEDINDTADVSNQMNDQLASEEKIPVGDPGKEESEEDQENPIPRTEKKRRRKQKQNRGTGLMGHGASDEIHSNGGESIGAVEADLASLKLDDADASNDEEIQSSSSVKSKGRAKEKRMQREKKRAAVTALEKAGGSTTCNMCGSGFESRSKLFDHIKRTGHAITSESARVVSNEYGGKGKGKKRR